MFHTGICPTLGYGFSIQLMDGEGWVHLCEIERNELFTLVVQLYADGVAQFVNQAEILYQGGLKAILGESEKAGAVSCIIGIVIQLFKAVFSKKTQYLQNRLVCRVDILCPVRF